MGFLIMSGAAVLGVAGAMAHGLVSAAGVGQQLPVQPPVPPYGPIASSQAPDWTSLVSAIAAAVAAVAAVVAIWFARKALAEARASGRDLKAAADVLVEVLTAARRIVEVERRAIAEERLRHRLERLLAVRNGLIHVLSAYRTAERLGAVGRWRQDGVASVEPGDPDALAATAVTSSQVELMRALDPFPNDELDQVRVTARQDALTAAEGYDASIDQVQRETDEVQRQLEELRQAD